MKRKILFSFLIVLTLFMVTGCGKDAELSAEEKAYAEYQKKTSPTVYSAEEDNYAEILKDRFGIGIKVIEDTGFKFKNVEGSIYGDAKGEIVGESISLSYKRDDNKSLGEIFKPVVDETKKISKGGKLYLPNDSDIFSTEEVGEDFSVSDNGSRWYYIWEGRTYSVHCYKYDDSETNETLYGIYFVLEKKDTAGNSKTAIAATNENCAELVKEYYGIDIIEDDNWKFEFVNSLGEFDVSLLGFLVNSEPDESEYEEYFDEEEQTWVNDPSTAHTRDEWKELAINYIRKYYDATAKVSKKGVFEADFDVERYENPLDKGKKITKASNIKLDEEGKCSWVYYYNNKLIMIEFDHYSDMTIEVSFTSYDY